MEAFLYNGLHRVMAEKIRIRRDWFSGGTSSGACWDTLHEAGVRRESERQLSIHIHTKCFQMYKYFSYKKIYDV